MKNKAVRRSTNKLATNKADKLAAAFLPIHCMVRRIILNFFVLRSTTYFSTPEVTLSLIFL